MPVGIVRRSAASWSTSILVATLTLVDVLLIVVGGATERDAREALDRLAALDDVDAVGRRAVVAGVVGRRLGRDRSPTTSAFGSTVVNSSAGPSARSPDVSASWPGSVDGSVCGMRTM